MKETWRNLWRRKLRTSLTTLGIMVGVLALTVMGAMSEKINQLVDGATRYFGTRIVVESRANVAGQVLGPPISASVVQALQQLPGVDAAFPQVYMVYQEGQEEMPSVGIGFPPLAIGVDARRFEYQGDRFPVVLSRGRFFRPGERGAAVVGVDLANFKHVRVGDTLSVKGREFQVVGLIERTLTVRDNIVFVPLEEAQELLAASMPPPLSNDPYSLASQVEVYPANFEEADAVAEAINRQVPGVRAFPPGEIERQFRQSLVIFNVIIVGSAVIAVVVGGLSILNTMVMAVGERTREIGIKKAVGATDGDILWEFLREAAVMGFVGGLSGLATGALLVLLINGMTERQGVVIFAVTPRLGLLVVLFATALGTSAGLFPALTAARHDPVQALRAE